jgi:tetratricopeptide (TPR) repeat protein
MKQYDSAIFYFNIIYDTAALRNDVAWMGITQGNLGIIYYLLKEYSQAEPLLKKDIETSILTGNNIRNAVNSMTVLAKIYYDAVLRKISNSQRRIASQKQPEIVRYSGRIEIRKTKIG